MTILTTIPNGASMKDVRDTLNDVLAKLASGGGTPTPSPAPSFTTAASIAHDGTPQVGETLTGNDGTIANGTVSARAWLLAGTSVGTGQTFAPQQTGDYTYRVTATGPGGTATSSSIVTVGAASAPKPSFATVPSITTDGTPQVGEMLTGVDGTVANGTITGRRWLYNGSQVATSQAYSPTQTGVHIYEVTATGAGGTTTATSSVTVAAAGTSPITVNRAAWDAEDNFDTGNNRVANRPNWRVTSDVFEIANSGLKKTSGAQNNACFGPVEYTPADNYEVEFDYNDLTNQSGGSEHFIGLWQTTPPTLGPDGFGNDLCQLLILSGSSAEGDGIRFSNAVVRRPYGKNNAKTGTVRVRVAQGMISFFKDGEYAPMRENWFGDPADPLKRTDGLIDINVNDDQLPASRRRTGKPFVWSWNGTDPILDGIRVRYVKCGFTWIDRFVTNRPGDPSGGDCWAQGWFTGAPSRWLYRVVSIDGTVRQNWTVFTPTIDGNKWSAIFNSPFGRHKTDISLIEAGYEDANGIFWGDISRRTSCGYGVFIVGQSNANARQGQKEAFSFVPTLRNAAAVNFPTAVARFSNFVTHIGNMTREFRLSTLSFPAADIMAEVLNAPVCIMAVGNPGSGLTSIGPGSGWWEANAVPMAAGVRGVLHAVILDQGEAESNGLNGPVGWGDYVEGTMIPAFRTIAKDQNVPVFFAPPGRIAQTTSSTTEANKTWPQMDASRQSLKAQMEAICAKPANNAAFSSFKTGVYATSNDEPGGRLHYSEAAYIEITKRDGYSVAKKLGAAVADGVGPKAATVGTRTEATISIEIDLNGASSVELRDFATGTVGDNYLPNSFKGWQFSADNFGTLLAVSSLAVAQRNGKWYADFTLSAAPSGPVSYRWAYGASYDDRSSIAGIYTDGRSPIPLKPMHSAGTTN